MTTLYCPCCEKRGLNAYTKWKAVESFSGSELNCEAGNRVWHHTYILEGEYNLYNEHNPVMGDWCQCQSADVDDDNARCRCGVSQRYRLHYILLKNAFYTESRTEPIPRCGG